MANQEQNSSESVDDLKAELNKLKSDVGELTQTLKQFTSEEASKGREQFDRARQRSREQAQEAVGSAQARVNEYPLTSLATAFGIGFIIGKILER